MAIFETLTQEQQALITKHLELVIEANETVNLTRITSLDEAMILHVEDSLTAIKEVDEAPSGLYADMGSGAGYPGIPLAVVTGRKTTLIDARQKKMIVMNTIIGELGMSDQVETYAGRAELLARKRAGEYAVITARALASLPILMELASPLLKKHGRLVCYKANVPDEELADARRVQKLTGMVLVSERDMVLAEKFSRKIITFEKNGAPTVKLPRQEGQAQKNPL